MRPILFGLIAAWLAGVPHSVRAAETASSRPACGLPGADGAMVCHVDRSLDPGALCNDRSVPAFWYRPGRRNGTDRWVIWLEGGGDCADQPSCADRAGPHGAPAMVTSIGFTAVTSEGVLSPSGAINPRLHDANEVLLHYCSSDTWIGGRAAAGAFDPADPATWSFQGRRIALAAVRSLNGMTRRFGAASQFIIGGGSAGAIGATLLSTEISALLPVAATKALVNDAGFTLNIGQFDAAIGAPFVSPTHPDAFEQAIAAHLAFWDGHGEARCDALAHARPDHDRCYNTAYVLQDGFVTMPVFVAQSQLDTVQLQIETCPVTWYCSPPESGSPQATYAVAFGQAMQADAGRPGRNGVYSAYLPDRYMHVMLEDDSTFVTGDRFSRQHISPRAAFDAWLADPGQSRAVLVGTGPGAE